MTSKPIAWRIYRNNRWGYRDEPSGGMEQRANWQPLYARNEWDSVHSCHTNCQNPACVSTRNAVAKEREECALICEQAGIDGFGTLAAAAAIRARGHS